MKSARKIADKSGRFCPPPGDHTQPPFLKQDLQFIGVIPYGNESHLRSDQVIRKDPAKPGNRGIS